MKVKIINIEKDYKIVVMFLIKHKYHAQNRHLIVFQVMT
jgi:hypothetical protein